MAVVFECDWEDGSDILNTDGAYEWASETDVDNKLDEASDSAMWDTDSLYWNGTSEHAGYLAVVAASSGNSGYRFGINAFSEGLSSGQQQGIMRVQDSGSNALFDCYLYDDGSNLLLYFKVYDTGGTGRNTSAKIISTDTNYQVVAKLQKNTAGGFYFSVYQEDGVTQVGSEIQLSTDYTTRNSNAYSMFTGAIFASWVTTEHGFDIVQVIDTYAYPDTIQAGGDSSSSGGIVISFIADIQGSSVTPSIAATIARALIADIQGASTTPGISATIERAIVTDINGASVTPSVSASIARALLANIQGASTTPGIIATLARAIIANIQGSSVTPDDITATLQNVISFIASITGVSVTPAITIEIARSLSAAVTGSSTTPDDLSVTIARALLADISGSSVTPTDLTLILAVLSIIDPTMTSITPARTMTSVTAARTMTSATPAKTIHST